MAIRDIPLAVEGFEGRGLQVRDRGFFRGSALFIDGKRVKRKKTKYLLIDSTGQIVEAKFHSGPLWILDPKISISIKGVTFPIQECLSWSQYAFSALPLGLLFFGRLLGAAIGVFAVSANLFIFRSKLSGFLKATCAFLASLSAVFFYFGVIKMINWILARV